MLGVVAMIAIIIIAVFVRNRSHALVLISIALASLSVAMQYNFTGCPATPEARPHELGARDPFAALASSVPDDGAYADPDYAGASDDRDYPGAVADSDFAGDPAEHGGADGLTADEMVIYHARFRNDPTRANADPGRHRYLADKYIRSELDEAEDSRWWGRHEV